MRFAWKLRLRRPRLATVLALVVAMGGTAYAVTSLPRNSVGTPQLQRHAVSNAKLDTGAVDGRVVRDGSLGRPDFGSGQLLTWRGAWRDATTYVRNNVVSDDGSAWVAIRESRGSRPPSGDWRLLARKGAVGPDVEYPTWNFSFTGDGSTTQVDHRASTSIHKGSVLTYLSATLSGNFAACTTTISVEVEAADQTKLAVWELPGGNFAGMTPTGHWTVTPNQSGPLHLTAHCQGDVSPLPVPSFSLTYNFKLQGAVVTTYN